MEKKKKSKKLKIFGIIQSEEHKEQRMKKNNEILQDLRDTIKPTHICITGVLEEERNKGAESLFEEIREIKDQTHTQKK